MTEFVLSLLSRGYSHVVKTDGQCGRLDVCFEPEDYFNWKSKSPLLRLSQSGRILSNVDPVPPKTYSTRRGPLILYSEDLALPSGQLNKVNRKGRDFRTSNQEEIQLQTLQDLTEAILAYDKKQDKVGCQTSVTQPVLPVPKWAIQRLLSHHKVGKFTGKEHHDILADPRPAQDRYQSHFFCLPELYRPPPGPLPPIIQTPAPTCSGLKPHPAAGKPATSKTKGPAEDSTTRDVKITVRTVVEIPRVQMSPIPEAESDIYTGAAEDQAVTVAGHTTGYPKDIGIQWKHSAIERGGESGAFCQKTAYMSPSLGCSHLPGVSNYRRFVEGASLQDSVKQSESDPYVRRVNTPPNPSFSICHLPPISQELPSGPNNKSHALKGGSKKVGRNQKDSEPQLPDIRLPDVRTECTDTKPQERTIHRKVLVLLPPQTEQDWSHGPPGKGGFPEDKAEREDVLCSGAQQREESDRRAKPEALEDGQKNKVAEHGLLIWFEPEEDKEHQSYLGPLPPLVGCRGPGKQSSMALFRQDLLDPTEQTEPHSGIIRGSLPLELRECQKGKALGTLIMGPAGEIIRLSFWDPLTDTEDLPLLNDGTGEPVLRVMSSDGIREQHWTIVLEEEQTKHIGEMSDGELKAKSGQKKQAGSDQEVSEDTALVDHTKAVEEAEGGTTDGTGTGDAQAYIPEERPGKANSFTENQLYRKGEHTKIQAKGRTQDLARPEGGGSAESPKSNSLSARHPQNTASSTPTAVEKTIYKATHKTHTEFLNDAAKTQTSEAGGEGGGDAEGNQVRKKKKKHEVIQKLTEDKHTEKKTIPTSQRSTATERQHSNVSANTTHDPVQKKKKAETEKSKTETSKLQNNVKKVSKKTKGQEPFVVGKPRRTQDIQLIENELHNPERGLKTASSSEMEESVGESACNCCGSADGHSSSADLVSVSSEDHIAPVSPQKVHVDSHSQRKHHKVLVSDSSRKHHKALAPDSPKKHHKASAYPREELKASDTPKDGHAASVSPREDSTTPGSERTDPRASVSSTEEPMASFSPRDEVTAPASFSRNSTASLSPGEAREDSVSSRTEYIASGSSRMGHTSLVSPRQRHETAVSPRSYSSVNNSVIGADNSGKNSTAASEHHNPMPFRHNQTSSQCSFHHSASNSSKTESSASIKGTDETGSLRDKKAAALAEKAERRRLEVEKKRKEREEELKRQQEREVIEEKMRLELEEEERQRGEQARSRKIKEDEERKRQVEREMERQKREQAMMERERKVQEEKRRRLERLQREKQEEEQRRAAEIKRQLLEEEERMEEERRKLLEMEEGERVEYLKRKREEEEKRQKAAEERRRADHEAAIKAEEEAKLLAELFARQRAALEQQLHFHRGLFVEAEGLEQTQDVSRPWVFSYFHLLKLLGMEEALTASDHMVNEML